MKQKILILSTFIFLQSCGMALLNSNRISDTTDPLVQEPENTFTVGGTVEGMPAGFALDLNINGEQVTVPAGQSIFESLPIELAEDRDGSPYAVEILTNLNGGYTCELKNGEGSSAGGDITDVQVICACLKPNSRTDGEIWDLADFETLLVNKASQVNGKFVQMCDIDFENKPMKPIGSFMGEYDGNQLSLLNYNSPASIDATSNDRYDLKGIFGIVYAGSVIKDVQLRGVNIELGGTTVPDQVTVVGGLVAFAQGASITGIFAEDVTLTLGTGVQGQCVGGLIGDFQGDGLPESEEAALSQLQVHNVYIDAPSSTRVGGVIGSADMGGAKITGVQGKAVKVASCLKECGGFIGQVTDSSNIQDGVESSAVMSNIEVTGSSIAGIDDVGGLIGSINRSKLQKGFFEGNVLLRADVDLGLSTYTAGGLIGYLYAQADVSALFSVADVDASAAAQDQAEASYIFGQSDSENVLNLSYLEAKECVACQFIDNVKILKQDSVNAYHTLDIAGTDPAIRNNSTPWLAEDWCELPGTFPSLRDVPFSSCI